MNCVKKLAETKVVKSLKRETFNRLKGLKPSIWLVHRLFIAPQQVWTIMISSSHTYLVEDFFKWLGVQTALQALTSSLFWAWCLLHSACGPFLEMNCHVSSLLMFGIYWAGTYIQRTKVPIFGKKNGLQISIKIFCKTSSCGETNIWMWGKCEIRMNGGVCKILCYFSRFWQIVDIGAFRPVLHLNFLLTYVQKNIAKDMSSWK